MSQRGRIRIPRDPDFLDLVITRDIAPDELVLGFEDAPFAVFDDDGKVTASYAADSANSYTTKMSHRWFGGYGVDTLAILLNGASLEERAPINLRSFDENADGVVDIIDLSSFCIYYSPPPKPYVPQWDYNADSVIDIIDWSLFAMHYGHQSPYQPMSGVSPAPQQTAFDVRLDFTEEVIDPSTRELRVDVTLENVTSFNATCVSLKNENDRIVFKQWIANQNYAKPILATPVIRDGINQIFIGVQGSKSFVGNTLYLGTIEFDVVDGQELNLTENDFELLVGDVLLTGGQSGVMAGVSVKRDDEIRRVYHNHLGQNYPNPFNPTTTIAYSIEKDANVHLSIFDVRGALVRDLVDEHQAKNVYRVLWDGRDDRGSSAASGVYFYRLTAGDFKATKKMVLLR